jgi:hypothetical protein
VPFITACCWSYIPVPSADTCHNGVSSAFAEEEVVADEPTDAACAVDTRTVEVPELAVDSRERVSKLVKTGRKDDNRFSSLGNFVLYNKTLNSSNGC